MANMNGRVVAVNGNMVAVEFEDVISKNEVGYIKVGDTRLKGEGHQDQRKDSVVAGV
jgi:V/A-type H+-transporting ATPase subunit A